MPLNIISFLLVFFQLFQPGEKNVAGNIHFANGQHGLVHQRYHIHLPTYYAATEDSEESKNLAPSPAAGISSSRYQSAKPYQVAACIRPARMHERSHVLHRDCLFLFHQNFRL